MNVLSIGLATVLSLSLLSTGCVDDDEQDIFAGADAGFVTFDAQPVALSDAEPIPEPDAEPTPVPDPGDFPIELACTLEDVQPILECVTDNCLDSLADGTLLTCVTFSCGLLLLTTPPECTQCIFAGITDTSMALDACVLGLDDLGGGFPTPQP
jgi:hypothetical protein